MTNIIPQTRTCTKCGKTKPVSEFYKSKQVKSGLRADCRSCCNQRGHESWRKNKAHYQEYHREYYGAHKEKAIAQAKEWYSNHKKERKEWSREYKKNHVEKYRAYARKGTKKIHGVAPRPQKTVDT